MRIGIIAPPWIPIPPSAYGGIESFIDVLARALQGLGHDVALAASSDSTCPVPRLPGFEPSDPAKMGVTAHELQHLLRAFAAFRDVDVILDNTLAGPVLAGLASDVPVVTVAHGPLIPLEQELYCAATADVAFVAISDDQASHSGPVQIARVIPHGIITDDVPVGPGGGYPNVTSRSCSIASQVGSWSQATYHSSLTCATRLSVASSRCCRTAAAVSASAR